MPLRFPRPVMALLAMGLACASIALGCAPALADQVRQSEWWLAKLGVAEAWQASRGSGVTVAVLSDGVGNSPADLTGAVITGPDYTNSGQLIDPYFGLQGTAIASLIAGHGHGAGDSSGIVGVAPAARILSVRVTLAAADPLLLTSPGLAAGLAGAIASGIRYAVARGATVIDLPLDPGEPTATRAGAAPAAGGSTAERAAVGYALSRDVVLVAPAGDDGRGTDAANYPAAYPGVIAVGAFDSSFVRASFSSQQPDVTITAAGDNVVAAAPGGGYQTMSSTSAASAVVAGIAALIRSRFPSLSAALVTKAMTSSTVYRTASGLRSGSGYGTVNAARALSAAAALLPSAARQTGALPRVQPARPAVASARAGLDRRLLRDLVVSAAVLIALLLVIAVYAAVTVTRRRGRAARPAAERRGSAPRAAPAGASDANRMLEFFAAPPAGTTAGSAAGSAAGTALPGRPAGGVTAPRTAPRRPVVSGSPPWGPAPEPPGELPWSALPASPGGGRPAGTAPPYGSPWGGSAAAPSPQAAAPADAGAASRRRGIRGRKDAAPRADAPKADDPRAAAPDRAAPGRRSSGPADPEPAVPDAAAYWPAADAEGDSDAGHGWSPGASTETLPAYPGELSPAPSASPASARYWIAAAHLGRRLTSPARAS